MRYSRNSSGQARQTLLFASAMHVWSDLFSALLVPLLFLIKEDSGLGLSFTQAGLIRAIHTGATAVLQIPFGLFGEQLGESWLLLGGNIWMAIGIIAMAIASNYYSLLFATLLGGLGGGAQHPLASSLISRIYDKRGRSTAVGTVNFAGDLGKIAAPAIALVLAPRYGWRTTMWVVGLLGIAFMGIIGITRFGYLPRGVNSVISNDTDQKTVSADNIRFVVLSIVGFLDSACRGGALVFLPFLLRYKGFTSDQVIALTLLLLVGGAFGKFMCGWLNENYGSISLIWGTKGMTAMLLAVAIYTPNVVVMPLMVVLGVGLNGTSSVLYDNVASVVPSHLRGRYYGLFYTTNEGGAMLSPILYGMIADIFALRTAMLAMALSTLMVLPASFFLRTKSLCGVSQ